MKLIECVPNFSEGRDRAKVEAIRDAIAAQPGAFVLRWEMDPDHNRSVITFAGPPRAVREAAFRGIAKAVDLIHLPAHGGVHPRIGAADVTPFIPLEDASMQECVELAHALGERVWRELGVPVYFYEAAALDPARTALESIRRGGFENARLAPDLGGPGLHPTAGACVIGARKLLIAFNVNLNTPDPAIARGIASAIRASSGGLPNLKAMGVFLASRNLAQVSMNLTDFEITGLRAAFDAVRAEAQARGVDIAASEIVGLAPRSALEQTAAWYLKCENFASGLVLENRLHQAIAAHSLDLFLDELSSTASRKGGGSASAAAGAMAAALGSKLCLLSRHPDRFEDARAFFATAVERDAQAFEAVLEEGPTALERAARVPLEVAEAARSLRDALNALALPAKFASDREAALALTDACRAGALAAARANVNEMEQSPVRETLRDRIEAECLYP